MSITLLIITASILTVLFIIFKITRKDACVKKCKCDICGEGFIEYRHIDTENICWNEVTQACNHCGSSKA